MDRPLEWTKSDKGEPFKILIRGRSLGDSDRVVATFRGRQDGLHFELSKPVAEGKRGFELAVYFENSSLRLSERRYGFTRLLKDLSPLVQAVLASEGSGSVDRRLLLCFDESSPDDALLLAEDVESLWTRNYQLKPSLFAGARAFASPGVRQKLLAADPFADYRRRGLSGFRAWVNEEADTMTSLAIGERLAQYAKETDCSFECLGEEEIQKEGLNLLAAVGRASRISPPRLFILKNKAARRGDSEDQPLVLVGKGITFDTGGINVKAFENLVSSMRNDMGGAALMSQTFLSLVRSGFERPLILLIPACENLVGSEAMKPGAVYRSSSALSVVVEHTDAEGRLILADALSLAGRRFKAGRTISAATLTTASLRQFTQFDTGAHFFNKQDEEDLSRQGVMWGEDFVFSRERAAFHAANHSPMADLTNMGRMAQTAAMGGGSQVAAHFLKRFASGYFCHLDIFSSTWNWGGDYPGSPYGATGAPFNSLFSHLRGKAQEQDKP